MEPVYWTLRLLSARAGRRGLGDSLEVAGDPLLVQGDRSHLPIKCLLLPSTTQALKVGPRGQMWPRRQSAEIPRETIAVCPWKGLTRRFLTWDPWLRQSRPTIELGHLDFDLCLSQRNEHLKVEFRPCDCLWEHFYM